jgi:hypothetical protein
MLSAPFLLRIGIYAPKSKQTCPLTLYCFVKYRVGLARAEKLNYNKAYSLLT